MHGVVNSGVGLKLWATEGEDLVVLTMYLQFANVKLVMGKLK